MRIDAKLVAQHGALLIPVIGMLDLVKLSPVSYTHLDVYKRQAYISVS